jgi:hypothetical protein
MSELPSQVDDVELIEVADGFVIYHSARDRVHFFNHTAAVVLELCDGTRRDEEIAELVRQCYELPQRPDAEIAQCLSQLREEGLVS